jgi:HNH endonuclease
MHVRLVTSAAMQRDKTSGRLVAVPLTERFWPKVRKTDGCWLWTSYTNEHGYGLICIRRHKFYAHRVSWELDRGPIPYGIRVLHRCDVPACVRPEHLFLGTQPDNLADMRAKGRGRAARGTAHGKVRFTEQQVLEMRRRYLAGEKRVDLMREFNVTTRHLWMIGTGRIWGHLSTPAEEPEHRP